MAVVGAIMRDTNACIVAHGILRPQMFYKPAHRNIFDATLTMGQHPETVDVATVGAELERRGQLDQCGGHAGLVDIAESIFTAANIEAHCYLVLEKYTLRQLIAFGHSLVAESTTAPGDLGALLEEIQSRLSIISLESSVADKKISEWKDLALDVSDAVEQNIVAHRAGRRIGICTTGLSSLDRRIGSFRTGELVVIGGRASMGKTAFIITILLNILKRERVPVGFFSLEMPGIDIGMRLVCAEAGVSVHRTRNGELDDAELEQIQNAHERLFDVPFYVDRTHNLTSLRFAARCHDMIAKHSVRVIVLDYLQLMKGPSKSQNREQEVASITRSCKEIALTNNVVVFALSQLSREAEKHGREMQGLPKLSDLRESGAIEQDADIVLFPWRKIIIDTEGHETKIDAPTEAKVRIAKQRSGPQSTVPMMFLPGPIMFAEMDHYSER